MPSTASSWSDVGFIDPGSSVAQLNAWFNRVIKQMSAPPPKPTVGQQFIASTGNAPPAYPKSYTWLMNELQTQFGDGKTPPATIWAKLTPAQKSQIVNQVGTKAIKDENAGSPLGNILIKPTMPLSLIAPFTAIPGAAGASTVGLLASGGIGTLPAATAIGELGTGIVTAASGAGGFVTGSNGPPKPTTASGPGEEQPTKPPIIVAPGTKPPPDPNASEGQQPPKVPPVVAPQPQPETPKPSNPFDAAISMLSAFHGTNSAMGRTPYEPVAGPSDAAMPQIRHSAQVDAMLREGRSTPDAPILPTGRSAGLGLVEGVTDSGSQQGASGGEGIVSRFRRLRAGLGIGS